MGRPYKGRGGSGKRHTPLASSIENAEEGVVGRVIVDFVVGLIPRLHAPIDGFGALLRLEARGILRRKG